MHPESNQLHAIVSEAQKIVVIQADNPDSDSLGSALALEQILGDLGKEPSLYCGVDIPTYIRYLNGWDRVSKELPRNFDASIIVDASTLTLLEKLQASGDLQKLRTKACIVLDHHASTTNDIDFASLVINEPERASTGELIYLIGQKLGWPFSLSTLEYITSSILGDTQGLTNELASAETYRLLADFIDKGVDRPLLEEKRREYSRMPETIFRYKAQLINRTELHYDGAIATVAIPQPEIEQYSPLYNPAPLVQGDMLQVEGVKVAIAFKTYADGKVTGAIRCNPSGGIGAQLAEHFGGGGHPYAAGFKITDGRSFDDIKADCLATANNLLAALDTEAATHESI